MGRKSKVTFEIKILAVNSYLNSEKTIQQISCELSVNRSSVNEWIRLYKAYGESSLIGSDANNGYSEQLKLDAVNDYLNEKGSLRDISVKYGLKSHTQLKSWIMKYNSHDEIKSSYTGGCHIMTKGRVTTLEERIDIVKYCIENNNDYNLTSKKYEVSYQQARSWTIKYKEKGFDGLIDHRGKRKSVNELDEMAKLKAQNKLLEAQNKRLEIENDLLKKLEEIERG